MSIVQIRALDVPVYQIVGDEGGWDEARCNHPSMGLFFKKQDSDKPQHFQEGKGLL